MLFPSGYHITTAVLKCFRSNSSQDSIHLFQGDIDIYSYLPSSHSYCLDYNKKESFLFLCFTLTEQVAKGD